MILIKNENILSKKTYHLFQRIPFLPVQYNNLLISDSKNDLLFVLLEVKEEKSTI